MDTFLDKNMRNFASRLLGIKVLYKTNSRFNGKLMLVKDLFGKRLLANGLSQSGSYIKKLWSFALSKVEGDPREILVLGLGAGSCLEPIRDKWPKARIVGVEIDPKMVEIGKKFFGLSENDLKIITKNAFDFLLNSKERFDLVLVDLFLGDQPPKESESGRFALDLKEKLNDKGLIIFNRLYFSEHKFSAQNYNEFLGKFFAISSHFYPPFLPSNMIIFCKNK